MSVQKTYYVIKFPLSGFWEGKFYPERDPNSDGWGPQHIPTEDLSRAMLFAPQPLLGNTCGQQPAA